MLAPGTTAPDFDLPATTGERISLSSLRGTPVVLVFVPFAFTGVCQGELCEIRDDPSAFEGRGTKVLAITCDSGPAQKRWAEDQGYGFPLLSDFWPHGAVAQAYGVFNDKLGCANRGTFVIDADGTIVSSFQSAGLREARTRQEYDQALSAL